MSGRSATPWGALAFLWRRSAWNAARAALARVREPRYALGALFGVAYFAWIFWIVLAPGTEGGEPGGIPDPLRAAAPLLLGLLALLWWMGGRTHMSLAFTPPEVQFLFPGPLERRALLDFKLVRAQVTLLPMALLMALFLRSTLPLHYLLGAASLWLLMTTIQFHQVAAGLIRTSWTAQGHAGLRGNWLPALTVVAAAVALGWAFRPLGSELAAAASLEEVLWALDTSLAHPLAVLVLLPFDVAVGPLVSGSVVTWLPAFAGGLALLALHYVWVHRIDASFEEAAAEAGVELQAITAAFKEGRLGALRLSKAKKLPPPWFRLAPVGHPAVAVFWKGFTQFTRSLAFGSVVTLFTLLAGFWVVLLYVGDSARVAGLAAMVLPGMLAAMTVVIGPLFIRNDLRSDFQRLESVRTFPLLGRDLVAAEVAASGLALTVTSYCFLTLAFAFFLLSETMPPWEWRAWAGYGALLAVVPLVCAYATTIQNFLAVTFPAWVPMGPTQGQGIDQTGAMMLAMLINAVLLTVGLVLPLIAGGVLALLTLPAVGAWGLGIGAAAAYATLAAEVVALVVLLGEAFDGLDPTEEGLLR